MILQSLVSYYEALAEKGEIARPGWGKVRVQYALEIDESGRLLSVLPLESTNEKGKPIPRFMELPLQMKRSGQKAPPYFLCDNAQYCLGLEKGQVTEKSKRCFSLFAEYHIEKLSDVDSPGAKALVNFLKQWNPETAIEDDSLSPVWPQIGKGGSFVFVLKNGEYLHNEADIRRVWNSAKETEETIRGRCLVTGELEEIARIHNSVKNIRTNSLSPNGWTLVGFDKEAFESYGKTQSYNAPVGKYAAFAYTTALNHLLADRSHVKLIGDTTVVYWAEGAEERYQDVFGCSLDGTTMTDIDLKSVMDALARGENVDWDGLPLNSRNRFYVLGIAPNAARLSVRLFLTDSFGSFERNLKEHYDRLKIARPMYEKDENLPLWKLLRETVNPNSRDKSASPQMSGDTLRAILTNGRYPATLYQQTMLRIRAERNVTRGRAAIVKAYILKNITDGFKINYGGKSLPARGAWIEIPSLDG